MILLPEDYGKQAIYDEKTRQLMNKVELLHGGEEFDKNYPDGIPSQVSITLNDLKELNSDFIMYPAGHARNQEADLKGILDNKF